MFTGKLNMDKLEKMNKRALRFAENQNIMPYEELCREANKLTITQRCIKSVAIQMYKIKSKTAPTYLQELFSDREDLYNLRTNDTFHISHFQTMTYGKKVLGIMEVNCGCLYQVTSEAKYHSVASNPL